MEWMKLTKYLGQRSFRNGTLYVTAGLIHGLRRRLRLALGQSIDPIF